jgi:hypothetical protein
LSTVFGLIASVATTSPDRGRLVTHAQRAEPQRLPHLLDDLQIRRDARAAVQVELDHRSSIHLGT